MNLCSVKGEKEPETFHFDENVKKRFFHFDSPEISQANLIVRLLLLTNDWSNMKRIRQERRGGKGGGWLWMWKLYLHTHTNNQQLWEKNAENSTHTHFLHFCMHNGSLNKSTNLVIFLHRGFVTLVKRQHFEWHYVFSSLCLSADEMKLAEGGFFSCSHPALSMMQGWFWGKRSCDVFCKASTAQAQDWLNGADVRISP